MSYLTDDLKKAFGMPSADLMHKYVFKSGEYGTIYQYWYRDRLGNYYRYTNAPVDHPDHNTFLGPPVLDPDQPLPENNPEFFSPDGYKRHRAVPSNANVGRNPTYSQSDLTNIWFEVFRLEGSIVYVYLDSDVKENLDLYVQNQLRVADSMLPKYREYATKLFGNTSIKDRVTSAILMLVDQGYYGVDELAEATVGDLEFVDQAIVLLGRKFVCDLNFLNLMNSIVATRAPMEPLFVVDSMHGMKPVGKNYLYSVFAALRMSPKFLLFWNSSHLFSRIVNRMSFQQLPYERMIVDSFDELARTLSTRDDVKYLVDTKVRDELFLNYRNRMMKSLSHLVSDDFGVAVIRSDLTELRADEKEFSAWIQSEPLHDATLEEAEAMPTPQTPKEEQEETSPEGAGSAKFQEGTEASEKAEAP